MNAKGWESVALAHFEARNRLGEKVDQLEAKIAHDRAALLNVIAVVESTLVKNDPYRVALDIAEDLRAIIGNHP